MRWSRAEQRRRGRRLEARRPRRRGRVERAQHDVWRAEVDQVRAARGKHRQRCPGCAQHRGWREQRRGVRVEVLHGPTAPSPGRVQTRWIAPPRAGSSQDSSRRHKSQHMLFHLAGRRRIARARTAKQQLWHSVRQLHAALATAKMAVAATLVVAMVLVARIVPGRA